MLSSVVYISSLWNSHFSQFTKRIKTELTFKSPFTFQSCGSSTFDSREGTESQNFWPGRNLKGRVHPLLNFITKEPDAETGASHLWVQWGARGQKSPADQGEMEEIQRGEWSQKPLTFSQSWQQKIHLFNNSPPRLPPTASSLLLSWASSLGGGSIIVCSLLSAATAHAELSLGRSSRCPAETGRPREGEETLAQRQYEPTGQQRRLEPVFQTMISNTNDIGRENKCFGKIKFIQVTGMQWAKGLRYSTVMGQKMTTQLGNLLDKEIGIATTIFS